MRAGRSFLVAITTTASLVASLLFGPPEAQADPDSVPVVGGGGTPSAGAHPGLRAQPQAAPSAARPAGYPVYGIDVSSHQGAMNWQNIAAAGNSFVYVKATEGTTYVNPYFDGQYNGAKDAGLYAGAYVFARPDGDPVRQADHFYRHAQYLRDGRTLPLMLDLEGPYGSLKDKYGLCWGRGDSSMVRWIKSFVDRVERKSGSPMLIYTNNWWWSQCTGNSKAFTKQYLNTAYWSSTPPTELPASWTHWTFWQYGIVNNLDRDVFHGSKAQLARLADKRVLNLRQQRLLPNDFNLDEHSNPAVFRPSRGQWRIVRDTGTTWSHFGVKGDIPTVWNWGDGWARMGVFRPSTGMWYLAGPLGGIRYKVHFGVKGDIPVQAHYRGAARTTVLAVFRPSTGMWYLRGIRKIHFGVPGDIPVPGHYAYANGGYADHLAVYRPSTGVWYLRGVGKAHFGVPGDMPVPADYDGDHYTDIAVYRPSTGMWYLRGIGTVHWGRRGDVPVTGDFNGDGKADIAVFRPSNGRLYVLNWHTIWIGRSTDIPIGKAPYTD